MMVTVRVGYTLEQCWHRVPGGTAAAAIEVASALRSTAPDLELVGLAGRHDRPPEDRFAPPVSVIEVSSRHGAALYASWLVARRPRVERAAGPLDVVHATTIIPCPTRAPLVVTVHDLAFRDEPAHFTRWGRAVFERSLAVLRDRAALVLCSSLATMDDCERAGLRRERLRHVPLGVSGVAAPGHEIERVRSAYRLPERFAIFVGTVEPRKNLHRLATAAESLELPLVVVGPDGWGDGRPAGAGVHFLGFVADGDLGPLYAAADVACAPSLKEGFGLPVLEAMLQGTPVVTSRGTSTEEVAGGAAVLVDPLSVRDIAQGIDEALRRASELRDLGIERAASMSWSETARRTLDVYAEAAR